MRQNVWTALKGLESVGAKERKGDAQEDWQTAGDFEKGAKRLQTGNCALVPSNMSFSSRSLFPVLQSQHLPLLGFYSRHSCWRQPGSRFWTDGNRAERLHCKSQTTAVLVHMHVNCREDCDWNVLDWRICDSYGFETFEYLAGKMVHRFSFFPFLFLFSVTFREISIIMVILLPNQHVKCATLACLLFLHCRTRLEERQCIRALNRYTGNIVRQKLTCFLSDGFVSTWRCGR